MSHKKTEPFLRYDKDRKRERITVKAVVVTHLSDDDFFQRMPEAFTSIAKKDEEWRMIMNTVPCGINYNMNCSHAQIKGSRHQQNQHPCEDAVLMRTTRDYLFYGLADGQSGAEHGAKGGQVCLEAIFNFIESVGIEHLLNAPFPDELPCAFVKAFRKELLSLAESSSADIHEFASTLLAIAVDLRNGKYILLHLGDGCVLSVPHTGDPIPISAPENGITSHHTWLTTSENAVSHFRVTFGSFTNKRRLLLLTDGATCFCRGRAIPRRARDLLKDSCHAQIYEHLFQSDPVDDATCIIIDVCEAMHP